MVKLTLYQNDANHLSALEYAITRFANDQVAEMVEAEIDCLKDGASLDYIFPRRIELYHPELKRPILYELWDAVCSNVVYDHLSPLKQFVMYQIIEEYIEFWREEPKELHFPLPEKLKTWIGREKDELIDNDTRESDFLVHALESAEEYPDNFFEGTYFLEEELCEITSLAMSNPKAFRTLMDYDELDAYIEIMPADLAAEYQKFREKQAHKGDIQKCGLNPTAPTAGEITQKIILALTQIQKNKIFFGQKENVINDGLRDRLNMVFDCHDQTRQGVSENEIDSGSVDFLIKHNGMPISIIEAVRIKSLEKTTLAQHILKVLVNYDPNGCRIVNLVIYGLMADFSAFWKKNLEYLRLFDFPYDVAETVVDIPTDLAELKHAQIKLCREESDIMFHVYAVHLRA